MLIYMSTVRKLKFEETPDYAYLRSLFQPASCEQFPPFDWLSNPAAQALIQSRVPPKPTPTNWDCNCSSSSSNSSEADDRVHPLSPAVPSLSPSKRRQTVSNIPEVIKIDPEERRQSLSEHYDQLEMLAMSPGMLMKGGVTTVGVRRNSCLPVMQTGEEAERKKLPEISPALRLKLRSLPN